MLARRASSSAVWKATSSRWSTTYWATSFCERENSSKREEMYADRVWWPCGGRRHRQRSSAWRTAVSTPRPYPPPPRCERCPHATRRPRPARARRARRRARLLHRDLPRGRRGREPASRRRSCRTTTRARAAARVRGIHFQTHPGQGKLVRCARGACRTSSSTCGAARRPSASGRASSSTTSHGPPAVDPGRLRARLLRALRDGRLRLQVHDYYDAATEAGIRFDDPDVGIEWPRGRRAALLRSATATRRRWPRSPTRCPSRV